MIRQTTFSDIEQAQQVRRTKREIFLEKMEAVIPWQPIIEQIKPYYYNNKKGRPAKGIEKMIRIYLLQIWFNLSDEGLEDAIYDSNAMKRFMGLDLFAENVPDATTLLKFRRIIEKKQLGEKIFKTVNAILEKEGKIMHVGVDAGSGIVHSVTATSSNVHDIKEVHKLIREDDDVVYGDAGYQGIEKREEIKNDEILNKKE